VEFQFNLRKDNYETIKSRTKGKREASNIR